MNGIDLLKQKVGSADPELGAQIAKVIDSSRLPGASTWLRALSLSLSLSLEVSSFCLKNGEFNLFN